MTLDPEVKKIENCYVQLGPNVLRHFHPSLIFVGKAGIFSGSVNEWT